MKKTFLVLPAIASFVFLPFMAVAQETGSLTCEGMLNNYDEYVPSMCGQKPNLGWIPGDAIGPGDLLHPRIINKPTMDWDEAQKTCENHWVSRSSNDFYDETTTVYEEKFKDVCSAVELHFAEEERRRKVAEKIAQDAQDQRDLDKLRDFLAGSTAK